MCLAQAGAALCLLLATAADGQARIAVQQLGRADGLPSTQVQDVVQDADGRLWFAGPSGLARYEGSRFDVFTTVDGLSSAGSRSLDLAPDGRLWIGTDAGVDVRELDGGFTPLVVERRWSHGLVGDLLLEPDGSAWIATAGGLLRWTAADGLGPAGDERLAGTLIEALARTADGTVWVAPREHGLLRFDGGRWQTPSSDVGAVLGEIHALAAEGAELLIGGERGLARLDDSGQIVRRLDGGPVSAILPLGDELWLGIAGELRLYRPRADGWELVDVVMPATQVHRLIADLDGNVWAATDNAGVAKISVLRHLVRQLETPCASQVFSISPTADGDVLIGGNVCSWRLRGSDPTSAETFDRLTGIKVWDLREDRAGTLWAASEQGLWRRSPGAELERLRGGSEILAAPGRVLLERPTGMWVGTITGLVEVNADGVRELTGGGDSLGYVYTLAADPEGRVWIGTLGNGLWRMDAGGSPVRVGGPGLADGNVYSVAFGRGGLVAVSQDQRLVFWNAERSWSVETDDAVAGWSLQFDADGHLWVGGDSGLRRYDPPFTAPGGRPAALLTATMGLAGDEFTTSRSLWQDSAGRLYCGTVGGLSQVDPGALADLRSVPPVRLAEVSWQNVEPRRTDQRTIVPSGRWTLDVRVFTPWYADEKSLTYRHRLRGFDSQWSPYERAGEHRIHYTALPAGDFELEVQAASPLGGTTPPATVLSFRVLRPWWARWWAIVLWAALLSGLIAAVWHRRSRVLIERAEELRETVTLKTAELREAVDKLDALAHRDPLTGLPNQRSFWEQARRFEARARRGTPFALVVIDLDDFKQVNDRFGHQVGDQVLKTAADRLRQVVRLEDTIARYGGEEFVVALGAGSVDAALQAAERLRSNLAEKPVVVAGRKSHAIQVTASLGVARWQGEDDDLDAMFKRADAAMYAAKRTTKNRAVLWDSSMTLAVEGRRREHVDEPKTV